MSVLVIGEVNAALLDLLVAQGVEHALRNHGGTVVHAHQLALDDRRNDQVDDLVDRDLGLVEHLGDDDHRVVAGLADTEGQVTGRTAHGSQHEPVAAGAGVDIDGARNDGTLVLGRLIAEGRRTLRQRKVVVDGLGNVDVGDGIFLGLEELGDAVGRRSGIVAADGHEQFDVVLGEEGQVEVLLEVLVGGLESAHLQERTALVEDAVGHRIVDVDRAGVGIEQARITFVETDHAESLAEERLGDAAHYGVHAGCRTAARKNCNCFFHDFYDFDVMFAFGAQNYVFFREDKIKKENISRYSPL